MTLSEREDRAGEDENEETPRALARGTITPSGSDFHPTVVGQSSEGK